jgi:hypothetical protein
MVEIEQDRIIFATVDTWVPPEESTQADPVPITPDQIPTPVPDARIA